ncbi:MAG: hypothetical protein ACREDR_05460 [Blastocatellia bacterium]
MTFDPAGVEFPQRIRAPRNYEILIGWRQAYSGLIVLNPSFRADPSLGGKISCVRQGEHCGD